MPHCLFKAKLRELVEAAEEKDALELIHEVGLPGSDERYNLQDKKRVAWERYQYALTDAKEVNHPTAKAGGLLKPGPGSAGSATGE